jgi:hypothetical protein
MPIEFTEDEVDNALFTEVELELDETKTSRFSLKVTKLFRTNAEASKSSSNTLKAKQAARHELLNSPDVFNKILNASPETKIWLEKVRHYSPVHFAVALLTVSDASFNAATEATNTASVSLTAPSYCSTCGGCCAWLVNSTPYRR